MPENPKVALYAHKTFFFSKNQRWALRFKKFRKKSHSGKVQWTHLWSALYFWKHENFLVMCETRTHVLLLLISPGFS